MNWILQTRKNVDHPWRFVAAAETFEALNAVMAKLEADEDDDEFVPYRFVHIENDDIGIIERVLDEPPQLQLVKD